MATELGVNISFETIQGRDLQNPRITDPIRDFLKTTYRNFWIEGLFDKETLRTTSEIVCLIREDGGRRFLDGAITINGRRLTMLGAGTTLVNPKSYGYFPGTLILGEVLRTHPKAWATVSSDEKAGSMADLFARMGFGVVNDLETVKTLYEDLGNGPANDEFSSQLVEHPILTRRFRQISKFMAFAHTLSVHPQDQGPYFQFAFKQ